MALALIVTLLALGRTRAEVFLTRGDLGAPVAPIRWLGVGPGQRWKRFGIWLTLSISGGTLAFLMIAGRPDPVDLATLRSFLPAVLLAAAVNAFAEEVTYKASLLSVLEGPVGLRQAVLMVAAHFGIGHYYGIPYGLIGVLLAGFLGWILARYMAETRGMFWAWFVHFRQDVLIFSFLAVGAITPGG
jgi:Type II CAAX prenyl endopeptidase Rce1-like